MNNVEGALFISASSISAYTIVLMLNGGAPKRRIPRYFLLYLLLETLGFLLEILVHSPTSSYHLLALGLFMGSTYLIGPCVWLFAQEVCNRKANLSSIGRSHRVVIVLGFLLVMPLMYATNINDIPALSGREFSDEYWFMTHSLMLLCVLLFMFQAPYYLRKSYGLFIGHISKPKSLLGPVDDGKLNALRIVIFVFAVSWLAAVLRTTHCMTLGPPSTVSLMISFTEVVVTVLALTYILKSKLGEPDQKERESETPVASKYSRSPINEGIRERIKTKLVHVMESEQVFRNNELTLRTLCDQLGETSHYVSRVINQDFDTNFFDMVNRYRIEYAKGAMRECPRKTILEIAEMSGFNSKSTFNSAFKKHVHHTPSQYRSLSLKDTHS